MAYKMNIDKHAYSFPTKIAASAGSPHIYNITLTTDTDNGAFVGRGDWNGFDNYKEAAAPTAFKGIIRAQAADGNYYVEVTAVDPAKETLYLYNSPILPYTTPADLADLKNFYNAAGDVVKGYALIIGDIVEESAEGFDGTPEVGKTVTIKGKKLAVATA